MNAEQFVEVLKLVVLGSAAEDCVATYEDPPGRSPSAKLKEMSNWYKGLTDTDKARVIEVMNDCAETALFGMFCVLDGVRAIEGQGDKGRLELYYVAPSGERQMLNGDDSACLHDLFNAT